MLRSKLETVLHSPTSPSSSLDLPSNSVAHHSPSGIDIIIPPQSHPIIPPDDDQDPERGKYTTL